MVGKPNKSRSVCIYIQEDHPVFSKIPEFGIQYTMKTCFDAWKKIKIQYCCRSAFTKGISDLYFSFAHAEILNWSWCFKKSERDRESDGGRVKFREWGMHINKATLKALCIHLLHESKGFQQCVDRAESL